MFQAMGAYEFWRQAELKAKAQYHLQMEKGDVAAATRAARIWVYADKRIRKLVFQQIKPFDSFD